MHIRDQEVRTQQRKSFAGRFWRVLSRSGRCGAYGTYYRNKEADLRSRRPPDGLPTVLPLARHLHRLDCTVCVVQSPALHHPC